MDDDSVETDDEHHGNPSSAALPPVPQILLNRRELIRRNLVEGDSEWESDYFERDRHFKSPQIDELQVLEAENERMLAELFPTGWPINPIQWMRIGAHYAKRHLMEPERSAAPTGGKPAPQCYSFEQLAHDAKAMAHKPLLQAILAIAATHVPPSECLWRGRGIVARNFHHAVESDELAAVKEGIAGAVGGAADRSAVFKYMATEYNAFVKLAVQCPQCTIPGLYTVPICSADAEKIAFELLLALSGKEHLSELLEGDMATDELVRAVMIVMLHRQERPSREHFYLVAIHPQDVQRFSVQSAAFRWLSQRHAAELYQLSGFLFKLNRKGNFGWARRKIVQLANSHIKSLVKDACPGWIISRPLHYLISVIHPTHSIPLHHSDFFLR